MEKAQAARAARAPGRRLMRGTGGAAGHGKVGAEAACGVRGRVKGAPSVSLTATSTLCSTSAAMISGTFCDLSWGAAAVKCSAVWFRESTELGSAPVRGCHKK